MSNDAVRYVQPKMCKDCGVHPVYLPLSNYRCHDCLHAWIAAVEEKEAR